MMNSLRPPVIGLTTYGQAHGYYGVFDNYVRAVRRSGGVPILLPPGESQLTEILALVDGVIFTGGGDIDPARYEGEGHPAIYKVDPERDEFEFRLAQLVLWQQIPVLGICRGLQVLNLVSGGSGLHPHVPDAFGLETLHRSAEAVSVRHPVNLVKGSQLAIALQTQTLTVTSWHHQAIPSAPPGWQASGYAPDGLIEAIEHEHHPCAIAVQWHPEMSLEDPYQQRIFDYFIAAVQKQMTQSLNRADAA